MTRTYIDSCVLMAAFQGEASIADLATEILDDPQRIYLSSQIVKLELLPKAQFHKKIDEFSFYMEFFQAAICTDDVNAFADLAYKLAATNGLSAMDALNLAAAIHLGADEFITAEKPSKPLFRVTTPKIVSIRASEH